MASTVETMASANGSTTPTQRTILPSRPAVYSTLPPIRKQSPSIWSRNDSHLVALFSFLTGIVLAGSLAFAYNYRETPQGWLFLSFLCIFHFLEYYITAEHKPLEVTLDAFLYNHGTKYVLAQALGFTEFLVELYFMPHTKVISHTTYAGLFLVMVGQLFRSLAMIHASSNFSHKIAVEKKSSHELVTTGVYALVRHPSYFGFFWWGVGTQIFLANPLSTVIFVFVLWKFFSSRIKQEEKLLVKFFGDEYVEYRKRVGTWIPFIH